MTDNPSTGGHKMTPIAIAIVVVAAIAAGVYIYKDQQNQKVFTMKIGGETISATVKGDKP